MIIVLPYDRSILCLTAVQSIGQIEKMHMEINNKGDEQLNFDVKIIAFGDRLQLCDWSILFFVGLLSPD